jgi:VanZ family protein
MSTDQAGTAGHVLFDVLIRWAPIDLHGGNRTQLSWVFQKFVHVALFASMGALAGRAQGAGRRSMVLVGVTAVLAEALQAFTFSRSAEWRDAILNLICVSAGYSLSQHNYKNSR